MKRLFAAAAAILMIGAACFAQDKKAEQPQKKNNRWEQIKAEKVGFITQKLDLSVEEAQVFWPVYNQFQKECATTGKALRHAMKALKPKCDEQAPTEKEMAELINAYLNAKKDADSVLEKYNKEFLKVIPASKVAKLYIAEEDFKRVVFDKFAGPRPASQHKGAPGEKPGQPKPKPVTENECQKPEIL